MAVTALGRRIGLLEASTREDQERRWMAAVVRLRDSMEPDHARQVAAWLRGHVDGKRWDGRCVEHGSHVCPRCLDRLNPPALARAVWFMLLDHVFGSGAPVAMPPHVAEVYLSDPQAHPVNPCQDCGYLLPARSKVRPDGSYKHAAWYMGECPVCGLDSRRVTQAQEEGTP